MQSPSGIAIRGSVVVIRQSAQSRFSKRMGIEVLEVDARWLLFQSCGYHVRRGCRGCLGLSGRSRSRDARVTCLSSVVVS